ncbi:MAG TPA: LysM peptidoglycan-binding domain-containing protein [Ilumatobacteraceae bacterium]|nr:LysM peptidoglycan-binding domain-containing protein [Ilumatobacteraceae bacterium]
MSRQAPRRLGSGLISTLVLGLGVLIGLPTLLLGASAKVLGHASPLHGMTAPWRWTVDDVHRWGRHLVHGLDSSRELVELFLRIALVVGWVCLVVLISTVVDELVFQLRNGMPSSRHRQFGGLGPIGRRLATALVAVLPLSTTTAPTLIGAAAVRPAVAAVIRDAPVTVAVGGGSAPVRLPAPLPAPDPTHGWSVIEVQRGDSVWAIAERVSAGRDIAAVADAIVRANLGAEMIDGHRFSTPALIEPGWRLNVPTSDLGELAPEMPPLGGDYVVEPGDSYWRIAEHHLPAEATGPQIADYTERLMDFNAPLLGYSERKMIHPGDVVHLLDSKPPEPDVAQPAPVEPVPVPAVGEDPPADPPAVPTSSLPPPIPAPTTVVLPPPVSSLPPPTSLPVPGPSSTTALIDGDQQVALPEWSDDGLSMGAGLAAATVLAGSVLAALAIRRRGQLRTAHVGARSSPPAERAVETERRLRASSDTDGWARLDLAVRAAAPHLAAQPARILAAELSDDGELRVYIDRPAMAGEPWTLDSDAGAWRLPAHVSLVQLAADARRVTQPCPAMVHLGDTARGRLFVDVEAIGLLGIDAPSGVATSIVRCVAASLAVSPLAESSRVYTIGLDVESHLRSPNVDSLSSIAEAVESLGNATASIAHASAASSTFALRAASESGEAWEPSLLLCAGAASADDAALASLASGGGHGVGIVIDRPVAGCGATLRAEGRGFMLDPLGLRLAPSGLAVDEAAALDELLASADGPLIVEPDAPVVASSPVPAPFTSRPHEFVVRLLGQVEVRSAVGQLVIFERSKAQELVVWLSQHRHRPTRGAARTALWETVVRDATFSNVVSDARRALARVVQPPSGQEWIGRTMNEDLPLHDLVVSDVELLADRVAAARDLLPSAAIEALRPGVALIEGMPFAGTSYLWPDAEGITSALVLLATSAAATLASHYLVIGDVDGVFWATGQGLKVLAGHEELIALRMRAHADRGDLAGVRGEWESYERALQADSWAAAEPSPKLVELRRQLLSPPMVA